MIPYNDKLPFFLLMLVITWKRQKKRIFLNTKAYCYEVNENKIYKNIQQCVADIMTNAILFTLIKTHKLIGINTPTHSTSIALILNGDILNTSIHYIDFFLRKWI